MLMLIGYAVYVYVFQEDADADLWLRFGPFARKLDECRSPLMVQPGVSGGQRLMARDGSAIHLDRNGIITQVEATHFSQRLFGASVKITSNRSPVTATAHIAGSRSWRTNNPGLLPANEITWPYGAIGQTLGVAVFKNPEAGRRALRGFRFGLLIGLLVIPGPVYG